MPGIGVAHPFIERQRAEKIGKIFDGIKDGVGKKIVDHRARRVPREARTEMPSGVRQLPVSPELEMDFRIGREKLFGDADHRGGRRGDAEVVQKYGRDPFIHQDPPVLRIVDEFDDVSMAVSGFEQVRLRPTAHFADQPARVGGHVWLKSGTV